MEIQDRVNQVRKLAKSNKDAINMLLSACVDMGSENGALLSVKAFDNAANHIIKYFNLNASQPAVEDRQAKPCRFKDDACRLGHDPPCDDCAIYSPAS